MIVSDLIRKYFPELASPNLSRKPSRKHWRKTRNLTRSEKAAILLTSAKYRTIQRPPVRTESEYVLAWICDDDIDHCVTEPCVVITIDVTYEELATCTIEIVGDMLETEERDLATFLLHAVTEEIPKR